MKQFKIKEAHLKLAKNMYVSWEDCEFGAPSIDCKRPYGNSNCIDDILEILGIPYDSENGNEALEDFAIKLHQEMETALQIFLCTQSFEEGTYEQEDYKSLSWKKL